MLIGRNASIMEPGLILGKTSGSLTDGGSALLVNGRADVGVAGGLSLICANDPPNSIRQPASPFKFSLFSTHRQYNKRTQVSDSCNHPQFFDSEP